MPFRRAELLETFCFPTALCTLGLCGELMNFSGMLREESRAPSDTLCSQCPLPLLCWQSCVTAGCWATTCKNSAGDGGGGIQFLFFTGQSGQSSSWREGWYCLQLAKSYPASQGILFDLSERCGSAVAVHRDASVIQA